jgi:hypothetical protein
MTSDHKRTIARILGAIITVLMFTTLARLSDYIPFMHNFFNENIVSCKYTASIIKRLKPPSMREGSDLLFDNKNEEFPLLFKIIRMHKNYDVKVKKPIAARISTPLLRDMRYNPNANVYIHDKNNSESIGPVGRLLMWVEWYRRRFFFIAATSIFLVGCFILYFERIFSALFFGQKQ